MLLLLREAGLRDLGGLMLEMYRRDQFRQDLLVDRCVELAQIEERLAELDALLAAAVSRGHAPVRALRVRRADLLGLEVLRPVRPAGRRGAAAAGRRRR